MSTELHSKNAVCGAAPIEGDRREASLDKELIAISLAVIFATVLTLSDYSPGNHPPVAPSLHSASLLASCESRWTRNKPTMTLYP